MLSVKVIGGMLFGSLLFAAAPSFAEAQEEGKGSIANEGHDVRGEGGRETECTAQSSDEECFEYWENHINWLSWDYKAGPDQAREHRHMPAPFGFALLNFVVFAAIMYRLAAKPLKEFVRDRHLTIKKDLDEAAQLHREAEARLREYEAKIGGLDAEIETLLRQVRAEAETEKARIVAGAEAQAKLLQLDAQAQIAAEVERVRRELRAEAVSAAMAVAESLVKQRAGEADQVKLTERFVADLESAGGPGTTSQPAGPSGHPAGSRS